LGGLGFTVDIGTLDWEVLIGLKAGHGIRSWSVTMAHATLHHDCVLPSSVLRSMACMSSPPPSATNADAADGALLLIVGFLIHLYHASLGVSNLFVSCVLFNDGSSC